MNITPIDIQQKRFHVGFRGYERPEVDSFLDQVREEMEQLLREVTELREFRMTYDDLLRELKDREENVKNTLLTTQKVVEEMKESTRRESAVAIKEAGLRSQQIVNAAQEEKVKLEADIQDLKRRRHHFLQDIKKVVQMHLEMVQFEEGNGEPGKETVKE
jgi:cell division initiation protein